MHVIFDVYTPEDETYYREILGEDEAPSTGATE